MQLPHFTPEIIKGYRKILREHEIPNGTIEEFCKLSPQQRLKLGILPADKMNDVEALVRVLPRVVCTAEAFTEN
jgi:hypothetical protein